MKLARTRHARPMCRYCGAEVDVLGDKESRTYDMGNGKTVAVCGKCHADGRDRRENILWNRT